MAADEAGGAGPPKLSLLCVGNPLLEVHAEVTPAYLEGYEIAQNAAIQVEARHRGLLKELQTGSSGGIASRAEYAAGGGAASSAQVVLALSQANEIGRIHVDESDHAKVSLLGSVGRDEYGVKLKELCTLYSVNYLFSDTEAMQTGWRAVLKTTQKRPTEGLGPPPGGDGGDMSNYNSQQVQISTATYTGAARDYKLDHLRFKIWESIEETKIVYVDAIFFTVSFESARIVAEHCAKMGKTFCINLSARYLCQFFADKIVQLIPYADYVFGNESEYTELAMAMREKTTSVDDIAAWVAKIPRADGNERKKRQVMVTNGTKPVLVASLWRGHGVRVQKFPIPPLRAGKFVCKDGAGDAFAGGFLYGLTRDADLDSCVQTALFAAHGAVQRTRPFFWYKDRPRMDAKVPIDP
eukprot:TRINITY_DN112651_c0_g1_i1.p1 TRINITY_DN112651_c0_g1~~TRINITY_DN112651_c0_g1_i1.p1  ORF type:complete len:410 (+),score=90.26 TRINITY_DN112651_c0_g1_i1:59-1288(+)